MNQPKKNIDYNEYRIMNIIHAQPDITQRKISRLAGISLGSVNYCLKSLIDKGFVKLDNFNKSNNKIGYIYILTPLGIIEKVELTGKFLKRKLEEYQALKAEIEELTQNINSSI